MGIVGERRMLLRLLASALDVYRLDDFAIADSPAPDGRLAGLLSTHSRDQEHHVTAAEGDGVGVLDFFPGLIAAISAAVIPLRIAEILEPHRHSFACEKPTGAVFARSQSTPRP